MIQFNKSIFQLTRRFAVLLILLAISNPIWSAKYNEGSGKFAQVTVQVDPDDAVGMVYASDTTESTPKYPDTKTYTTQEYEGTKAMVWYLFGSDEIGQYNDITFKLYANDRTNEGYIFGGWWEEGATSPFAKTLEATKTITATTPTKKATYTAKWLRPKVTLATPNALSFDEIDDPTATVESKPVVFTIADYMDKSNYDTKADNSFEMDDASDDPINEEANTYTVSISYEPTGIHGLHKGSAKLASTLDVDYDNKEQIVSLSIEEDYTPIFNANYDSEANRYPFADVALGGQPIESNVAFTKDNNYAASVGSTNNENVKYGRALWTYTFSEFSLAGQDVNNFFSIKENTGDAGAPVVVFTPGSAGTVYGFAAGAAAQQVVTAKMTMKCTYYDANGVTIESEEKHSYLQVTVKQENTSIMRFNDGVSGDFGEVIMGEQPSIDLSMYIANVSFGDGDGCVLYGTAANLFTVSTKPENGKVTVSISDKWEQFSGCDEHTATLTVTGTRNAPSADGANDSGQKVSVTMNLTATLILKDALVVTPSYGNGWVSFTWNKLPGAKRYDLYIRKGTTGAFTKTTVLSTAIEESQYTHKIENLVNGSTSYHECYVVAMVDEETEFKSTKDGEGDYFIELKDVNNVPTPTLDPQSKCIRISSIVNATPVLDWIYAGNAANTGLYTGIVGNDNEVVDNKTNAKYREVDVSAAFDADGNALFDRLYIFVETNQNKTPLKIFSKTIKNGISGYSLGDSDKSYNEVDDVQSARTDKLTINLNTSDDSSISSLYFTGFCPAAYTGDKSKNGVIHIIGSNKTLHIYVDDLQIYAKNKTDKVTIDYNAALAVTSDGNNYYTQGKGSIFVLQSTTVTPVDIQMHIRRKNIFVAGTGTPYEISVYKEGKKLLEDKDIKHYSSPISILPTRPGGVNLSLNLTLDDLWQGVHTNGELDLQKQIDTNNKPNTSIDLGNEHTKLTIKGGQYKFLSIAASYCKTIYSVSGDALSMSINAFGIRGSNHNSAYNATHKESTNAGNAIILKDGTFTSSVNKLAFYASDLDIDGGTYNISGDVYNNGTETYTSVIEHYTADGVQEDKLYNSDNKEVVRFEISNNNYWTSNENSTLANITAFPNMVDDLFPDAGINYFTTSGDQYHTALSMYYVNNKEYGHATLNPYSDKLYLMLPKLDCKSIYLPWQICAPTFELKVGGTGYNMGGGISSVNACQHHDDSQLTTDYLLFMQADSYTMGAVGSDKQYFNTQATSDYGKVIIDKKNNNPYSTISEADDYTIQKKVYMLKPIVADEWMLFTAPFDVANIYIIESYPEAQILKDFKTYHGMVHPDEVAAVREAQAQRTMDLFAMWYFEEKGQGDPYNFFNGDGTTDINGDGKPDRYGKFVLDWIEYEKINANNKLGVDGTNYTPEICQLVHFNGSNANQAHYFLYEQAKEWEFNSDNNFTTYWKEVATTPDANPNSTKAIMTKGNVYAMQFPYNIIGGTHDPSKQWDYWTGKYILIESTSKTGETIDGKADVHTISGSDYAKDPESTEIPWLFDKGEYTSGKAMLCGNATFAELVNFEDAPTGTSLWTVKKKAKQDVEVKNEDGTTATTVKRDVHEFVPMGKDASLSPAEGMIVANFTPPANMRARSINYRTGVVTYEKIDNTDPGLGSGLQTILGDATLLVEPTPEGLTITPLKEQHVMLFDANGKMIFSKHLTAEENVTLPTGVYVVRGEYEQVKAIKK